MKTIYCENMNRKGIENSPIALVQGQKYIRGAKLLFMPYEINLEKNHEKM